jgi:hypothetical protein
VTVETRYFRQTTTWVVNGLTAFKLQTTNSTSGTGAYSSATGNLSIYWGIRVWKRVAAGTETEITAGTPVAQVSRSEFGYGEQSETWACPLTVLVSTDAIVARIYYKMGGGDWTLCAEWISEQLGAVSLDAATWTVTYRTTRYEYDEENDRTSGYVLWGQATWNSRIANFTLTTTVTYYKTLAVTAVAVLGLSKALIWKKTLAIVAVAIPGLSKLLTWKKTLSVQAVAIVNLSKLLTWKKTLAVVAVAIPGLSKLLTWKKSLSVQGVAVVNLLRSSTFHKTLSVIAVAIPGLMRVAELLGFRIEGVDFKEKKT